MAIDPLAFAFTRIGEDHRHHRHCVHNLSAEEQKAAWLRHCDGDEDMYALIYGDREPLVITPDEWEIDVPDLDWSAFEGGDS